jgi:hypothetical protein
MPDAKTTTNGAQNPATSQQGPLDVSELIRHLKKVIRHLHPDSHRGKSRSKEDEEALLEATAALKKIEDGMRASRALTIKNNNEIAPLEGSRELAEYAKERALDRAQAAAERKERVGSALREGTKERFTNVRWIARSAAAIFTALLAVSAALGRNPLVAPLLGMFAVRALLVAGLLCSGTVAVVEWLLEKRASAFAEWLVSKEAQAQIFRYGVRYRAEDVEGEVPETVRFTKVDVIEEIEGISERKLAIPPMFAKVAKWFTSKTFRRLKKKKDQPYFDYRVDLAITRMTTFGRLRSAQAEQVATIHLDDLSRRGVIREASDRIFEEAFLAEKSIFADP